MENDKDIKVLLPSPDIIWINGLLEKHGVRIVVFLTVIVSVIAFYFFYQNGLGLSYNDARSHLDISRRVVESLKPGIAQLGSVWLPLPHILMLPFVWNDFLWHSGLAGAITSMASFVATSVLIYLFLRELGVGHFGRIIGVTIFITNVNILYLQSTAMTELLLLATMTAASYELFLWHKNDNLVHLILAAFFVFLSTLSRYDGWFLLVCAVGLIIFHTIRKKGYKTTEGMIVMFLTLAGFGIFLWLLWNQLIFNDALYFAFGPFSAKSQQDQILAAGSLPTKGNLMLSVKVYFFALMYNSNAFILVLAMLGAILFWFDKKFPSHLRVALLVLIAPLGFNILALYMGHAVLYVANISGNTWFNVRYGIMLMPAVAIFVGYLAQRWQYLKTAVVGLILFVTFFSFFSFDAVTIDDARVGASQKNVSEVSGWLNTHAENEKGFVLISAASHDAIIFSSGLPMSKFIHEGTGLYWEHAIAEPQSWAKWIVMRTQDDSDMTYRLIKDKPGFKHYTLIHHYPFADIYELQPQYWSQLTTDQVFVNQK